MSANNKCFNEKLKKMRGKGGFTVAELMIVVAIIVILFAVTTVSIFQYQRGLTKLQYDAYAKEIFVAAQNHLAMAENQNYLGLTSDRNANAFGFTEDAVAGETDTGNDNNYFVVNASNFTRIANNDDNLLKYMLPYGAVDDTVRLGGCYVIRYNKPTATVLDVFYWQEGSGQFDHRYVVDDYPSFMQKRGESNKAKLREYSTYDGDSSKKSVIGYYGGAEARTLVTGSAILAPEINVVNAERLYVTLTDKNSSSTFTEPGYGLKLIVTGKTSGMSREIPLITNGQPAPSAVSALNIQADLINGKYTIVLDDITTSQCHFADLFCLGTDTLIPGEDISIRAVAYNNVNLTNIAYSPAMTTNSLFGNASEVTGSETSATADIMNIRHLENLSANISGVNSSGVTYTAAKQGSDLSWNDFKTAIGDDDLMVYQKTLGGQPSKPGTYMPVDVDALTPLAYNGGGHTVSDLVIDTTGNAGMFGTLGSMSSVSDLRLSETSIIAGESSGALAGKTNGCTVTNVLAVNSAGGGLTINGNSAVGGLIGTMAGGRTELSAASVLVNSAGAAGGLIGMSSSGSVVASYSGGRTENGIYTSYNITGAGSTGGLIGNAGDTTVSSSYSTCSVNGQNAGGLVGSASGGSYTNSYATGLVKGTGSAGAFAGSLSNMTSGSVNGCSYYEIINETNTGHGYTYLGPVGGAAHAGITPFDADRNPETFDSFVTAPNTAKAEVFDSSLNRYYHGNYELRSVAQLGVTVEGSDFVSKHFGDWPAPEIWVINQ